MSITTFFNSLRMPELTVSQDSIDKKMATYKKELEALGFETTSSIEASFINLVFTKTLRATKNNLLVCLRLDGTGYEDLSVSLERGNFTYRLPNFYKDTETFLAAIRELDITKTQAA